MRVSFRRIALALTLPAIPALPALAEEYYQPPAAIALFSGADFYGEVREAFDPFPSMHDLAFNDRARSVAVLAGQWELCEHANFTGRCVFIREDVADLSWFGLTGRVSSIRPIFEYTEALHGLMFTRDDYGYIRYAHEERWGDRGWNYGYSSSVNISVRHYGYSQDYLRFGYYDPRWGYDPYGFAWSSYGGPRYVSYVYRVHPRPVVINNYWQKSWGKSHKHWDRRSHKDDWRRRHDGRPGDWHRDGNRRGNDNRWTGGGRPGGERNWRDGDRDGRGGDRDWRNADRDGRGDDRRGRGEGTGRPGDRSVDVRDRAWGPGDRDARRGSGVRADTGTPPRTGGSRAGAPRVEQGSIPADPRRGNGSWQGNRSTDADRGDRPRGDRGDRGQRPRGTDQIGRRDMIADRPSTPPTGVTGRTGSRPDTDRSRSAGQGRSPDRLLGAPSGGTRPVADTPRRGGSDSFRGGGGRSGAERGADRSGGDRGRPARTPSASSPPAARAPQAPASRPAAQPTSRPAPQSRPAEARPAQARPAQARPSSPPPAAVSRPSPPPRAESGRGRGGSDGGGRGGRRPGSAQD